MPKGKKRMNGCPETNGPAEEEEHKGRKQKGRVAARGRNRWSPGKYGKLIEVLTVMERCVGVASNN